MKHHGMHEEQAKNHGEYAKQHWDFYYMQNPELALNLDLVNWSYALSPCKNVHTKEKEKEKEKTILSNHDLFIGLNLFSKSLNLVHNKNISIFLYIEK